MKPILEYHHFKPELFEEGEIVARYERFVVDRIISSPVSDSERENSKAWELKHHAGCLQFARLLARKRNLPLNVCSVGMLLHDIYAIDTGRYKNHARLGEPIARRIVEELGGFDRAETEMICEIVREHSDKHIWGDSVLAEFGKDVDILDCFLYPDVMNYYLQAKRINIVHHYLRRAARVRAELGVPSDKGFGVLDGFRDEGQWMNVMKLSSAPVADDHRARIAASDLRFCGLIQAKTTWLAMIDSQDASKWKYLGIGGSIVASFDKSCIEYLQVCWPMVGVYEEHIDSSAVARLEQFGDIFK